jgi:excisionase family DNA binding protein
MRPATTSPAGSTARARLPAHLDPIIVQAERPARPLTREQAASELGLHARTLDRWARRGQLLTIHLGGIVRIPAAEARRLQATAPVGGLRER